MLLYILVVLVVLYVLAAYVFPVKRAGPRREYQTNLEGQVVIITGCSAGIGKETARKIAQHKATVIFACRSQSKTQPIMEEIRQQTNNQNLRFMELDLSNQNSVHRFVQEFKKNFDRLDVLINNAGIYSGQKEFNKQGHELTFATNHLGHFLLTNLLLDYLKKNKESRVINVSSEAHRRIKSKIDFENALQGKYEGNFNIYALSKYANIVFTQGLNQLFEKEQISCKSVSLHPGVILTEIFSSKNKVGHLLQLIYNALVPIVRPFLLTEEEGSWTTVYTALMPYEQLVPNGYYERNQLSKCTTFCRTSNQSEELWKVSKEAVNIG